MKLTRRNLLKYLGGLTASAVVIPYLKPKKDETYPFFINPSYTDTDKPVFTDDMFYIDADGKTCVDWNKVRTG